MKNIKQDKTTRGNTVTIMELDSPLEVFKILENYKDMLENTGNSEDLLETGSMVIRYTEGTLLMLEIQEEKYLDRVLDGFPEYFADDLPLGEEYLTYVKYDEKGSEYLDITDILNDEKALENCLGYYLCEERDMNLMLGYLSHYAWCPLIVNERYILKPCPVPTLGDSYKLLQTYVPLV